jgi:hypothetical protein
VEIGAGQAIEQMPLSKKWHFFYFVAEADDGGDVLDYLVMVVKMISEADGGGEYHITEETGDV